MLVFGWYSFAIVKKIISAILFSIFLIVQAGPAVQGLFSDTASLLIMDEDKSPDKSGSETKKYSSTADQIPELVMKGGDLLTAIPCSERLCPSPYLEIPGLPPDHC